MLSIQVNRNYTFGILYLELVSHIEMLYNLNMRYKEYCRMHVIAKLKFTEAAKRHPSQAKAIMDTYATLNKARFENVEALKTYFKSVERFKYIKDGYVIDIAGNHMRLIAVIFFKGQKLFVKHVVNHSEYDKLNRRYREGKI